MTPHDDFRSREQKLEQRVEKQVRRIRQAGRERRTLLGDTVYLGAIGIMMVLPIVAGAYLGRWLDSNSKGYAVHWTISMIFLGVVIGAINVYLFVRE
jgi:ATP synthase protein I